MLFGLKSGGVRTGIALHHGENQIIKDLNERRKLRVGLERDPCTPCGPVKLARGLTALRSHDNTNFIITLLTLSSTEDFSSNNLTYMDVYLLLTKTLKRDYFHREKEN